MGLLDLNKEQQKAFNRLKRAYKDAEKLGVLFVNQYGTMTAYNSELVLSFGDDQIVPTGHCVPLRDVTAKFYNDNTFKTCSGVADDEHCHVLGLTNKGLTVYKNESDY